LRREICTSDFTTERDGYPCDFNNIFLTAGASAGVDLLIDVLISSTKSGILIPIPQYPLYTATLARHNGTPIPYYLDETSNGWTTSVDEVERSIKKALSENIEPKALVIINPGNPVGSVLALDEQKALIRLCEKYNIVLLADEVYQVNIHTPNTHTFTSFKKIVRMLDSHVPLVSFHSISKGVTGECGRRGGYFEAINIPDDSIALLYKMVSVGLCPPIGGQIGVDCMVRPPKPGDESHELWKEETETIRKALAARTVTMATRLNALPAMSCSPSPGSLYLFPRLHLPPGALKAAKEAGRTPDGFYAHALLDETGICVISGDGFGQKDGEAHFRLTCLCAGVDEYVDKLETFHRGFIAKYGGQ
jgi:alanine transaminase